MSKRKNVLTLIFTALFFAIVIFSTAFITSCKISNTDPVENNDVEEPQPQEPLVYIESIEAIDGGFKIIYSDGTNSETYFPKEEEVEKETYVVSLEKSDDAIVINYSDGTSSALKLSEEENSDEGGTPETDNSDETPSQDIYVTKITSEGDGYISVEYSDGTNDVVETNGVVAEEVCATKIEQTSTGLRVTYSDGTRGNIISIGDMKVTLDDIYNSYTESYSNISFDHFVRRFLNVSSITDESTSLVAANRLRSTVRLYTEFIISSSPRPYLDIYYSTGTIWKVYDDYTYIVANYSDVYSSNAYMYDNNNSKIARKIYAYVYGDETEPKKTTNLDLKGYEVYSYGSGFDCEYVGGSVSLNVAVVRVQTKDIKKVAPFIQGIECAEDYTVGETAIAICNSENDGLSVTKGVVNVDSEYLRANIDGTVRDYRLMRTDAALYEGSSGGGLYDIDGKLIGITFGNRDYTAQNVNYATPVQIVRAVADSLIYNNRNGSVQTNKVYTINIGASIVSQNAHYEYEGNGKGKIKEEVIIDTVTDTTNTSLCGLFGLESGTVIYSVTVDNYLYMIYRAFDLTEALYHLKSGSLISISYLDGSNVVSLPAKQVNLSQLIAVK